MNVLGQISGINSINESWRTLRMKHLLATHRVKVVSRSWITIVFLKLASSQGTRPHSFENMLGT